MKLLTLFISLSFSISARSANTVRILDVSTLTAITGHTNLSHSLVAETSGDATVEEAPGKVYVPIETTTTATTKDYFYLNSTAGPNHNLFGYTAGGGSKATYASYYITFPLVVSVDTTSKYLYAAVKSASSYIVIAKSSLISSVTNLEYSFDVSPQSICEGAAAGAINCSNFDDNVPGSVNESIKAINVYFFVSSAPLTLGAADIGAPDTSTYPGGIFFQVNMSNQIYKDDEINVSLSNLRKGDRRIIGTFTSSSSISSAYKGTYAYLHDSNNDTCVSIREPGRCQGSFVANAVSTSQNGDFTLSNLPNGEEVRVSVGLIDKFGFSTTLSNSAKESPTEIQELLKKQACFLLTAGFGEEHYVISFFRKYRDQVLAHTWPGRKFIKAYYRSAPHYALIIYKNEWMRFAIRSVAYCLYFLFNYYALVLIFISIAFLFNLSKIKMLILKNRLE